MLTIISFFIVLSVLVFAHELGHFMTARKFGVKAEEFGFGFPPRIFGYYKSKSGRWKKVAGNKEVEDAASTIYSANWIPIGGFVKLKGEEGPQAFEGRMKSDLKDICEVDSNDSLVCKPIWQRMIIMSAGVIMNIILAAVLFSIGFMIGLPQPIDIAESGAEISNQEVMIVMVEPGSPAEANGFQASDVIVSINGKAPEDVESVIEVNDKMMGKELNYKIKREGAINNITITPVLREGTGRGGIGVGLDNIGHIQYPWYLAIWKGVKLTLFYLWFIIVAIIKLLWGLVTGQGMAGEVAGPIKIAEITGQYARMGMVYLLQFAAILSINLAVINSLPFPVLDGGHVLFLLIEKIKGSPVRAKLMAVLNGIGFFLLMLLMLIVVIKEVKEKFFPFL